MKNIKTYEEWSKSEKPLSEFLTVGDYVDDDIVNFFLECLPPLVWTDKTIQQGEAHDLCDGEFTYSTLLNKKDGSGWFYAGTLPKWKWSN